MTGEGQRIVDFYAGEAPDDRGRMLEQILAFDDAALEYTHDFIQWLFPLRDRSGANPSAPRLDDGAVAAFEARPQLRAALRRALDRMLAFYGMEWRDGEIVRGPRWRERDQWLTPYNHNHLRLTRMLVSLRTLGLRDEAGALYAALRSIAKNEGRDAISAVTLRYWDDAALV